MRPRPLSVIRDGTALLTGHFQEGIGYGTVRELGTTDWLIIYTAAGGGRYAWQGPEAGEWTSAAGDITLQAPGARHDYRTSPTGGRWDLLWAHVHPRDAWLDLLDWPEVGPGLMRLRLDDPALRQRVSVGLAEADRLASGPLRRREQLAMNALEAVLLWCDAANAEAGDGRLDPRIRAAMELLCRDLPAQLGIARLARGAGLSPSRFAHLFRDQVGISVARYRERQRLQRACELLTVTDRTVQAVADSVGYPNAFHFSTRFRTFSGLSPRAYRKRHRGR